MATRVGLQRTLAIAIDDTLRHSHALTLINVKRHVTRDLLTLYRIRRETLIYDQDWIRALQVLIEYRCKTAGLTSRRRGNYEVFPRLDWFTQSLEAL